MLLEDKTDRNEVGRGPQHPAASTAFRVWSEPMAGT